MFQYSNLWNYGPQYGADWNLTIDIKCVDLTDDTGTWLPEPVYTDTMVRGPGTRISGNHDTGICSAGLHNCDEQGFCLDHHSVVFITDEEIDHLGSGFIFSYIDVGDRCWTRNVPSISL